jgi:hypothetical protein
VERPDARPDEPHLLLARPDDLLALAKVISRLKRSATIPRMSATLAEVSVQKYARQPVGSSTSTTRIAPPAGRQVARNVLYA